MRRVTGCGNSAAGGKARRESFPGAGSQAEKTTRTDDASKDSAVKGSRQSAVKAKQGRGGGWWVCFLKIKNQFNCNLAFVKLSLKMSFTYVVHTVHKNTVCFLEKGKNSER